MSRTVAEYGFAGWSGRGSLDSLVRELERQIDSRVDFVCDTRHLAFDADFDDHSNVVLKMRPNSPLTEEWLPAEGVTLRPNALEQIGEKVNPSVPSKFIKTLAAVKPQACANLLNDLFFEGSRQLVRVLDGSCRAFLSDSYRCIDSYDLAFKALEVAKDVDARVLEASLSERAMRIKFIHPTVWEVVNETRLGDKGGWYAGGLGNQKWLSKVAAGSRGELPGGPEAIYPAVTIGNSETGNGGVFIRLGILRGVCFNLATVEDVVWKAHLGAQIEAGVLSRKTIMLQNQVLMSSLDDSIRAAFDDEKFRALVAKIEGSMDVPVTNPTSAVNNIVRDFGLTEESKASILEYFLGTQYVDQTAYGLAQAVARAGQDFDDADRAEDYERAAGAIMLKADKLVLA